jgi:tetratricopeptide (TPR) repeat protein
MVDRTRTAELLLAVGGDQLFLGRYQQAIARFHEALRIDPNCVEAYTWMGRAYRDWGRLDEAAKAWREALRLHPDNTIAHYYLGEICVEHGDRQAAHKHYLALRELHPIRAERLWEKIQAQRAGETDRDATGGPPPSAQAESGLPSESAGPVHEEELSEPGPESKVRGLSENSGSEAESSERAGAESSESAANSIDHETVDETPEESVDNASTGPEPVKAGEVILDDAEAEILDDASAATDGDHSPDADTSHEDTDEPDEMKVPGDPHESSYTGLTEDGDPALSELERWKRAVESDPRDADAHWHLGRCYLDSGEHALAAESIEQAIANRRDFAGSHPESVRDSIEMCLALGSCYERLGRFERAVDIYEQSLALAPENPEAHLRLGLVALVLNNRGEAVERYRTLARIDPVRAKPFLERLLQLLSK